MMKLYNEAQNAIYLYNNGYLDTLSKERKEAIIGASLYKRFRILLNTITKEFLLLFSHEQKIDLDNKIVCLVNSTNNYQSLEFLKNENVIYLKATVLGKSLPNVNKYVFKYKFFYSILFLLLLPIILIKKQNRQNLVLLHKSFGLQKIFKGFIKKHKPDVIVFANDHTPDMRSYILACKELNLKTVYIQHGTVSKYFPPLIFDTALLDSKYSQNIYKKIAPYSTKVKLVGIPKLDTAIAKIKKRNFVSVIGIAVNQNDDLKIVNEIVNELIANSYSVILRKHPSDVRKMHFDNKVKYGNTSDVLSFINQIDFLIASDSSIHVEANSLKCRSVYFMLHNNQNKYDYYGFVKNKFVDEVKSKKELIQYIQKFEYSGFNFFSKELRYYNAALRNDLYANSSELTKKYIYESINR